jgi:putative phosphoesterase
MRVGIVSDIHCNVRALETAIDLMGPVDELICVGDSIYEHRFSNEVVGLLRRSDVRMVLGNHEATFLSPLGVRARSVPTIDQDELAWLQERPHHVKTSFGDKTLLIVHGAPWSPFGEYVYPKSRVLSRFGDVEADYVVMGHTHNQMVEHVGNKVLINPGSAGEGRDQRNQRRLSFAILDSEEGALHICNFKDPARPLDLEPGCDEPTWSSVDLEAGRVLQPA